MTLWEIFILAIPRSITCMARRLHDFRLMRLMMRIAPYEGWFCFVTQK